IRVASRQARQDAKGAKKNHLNFLGALGVLAILARNCISIRENSCRFAQIRDSARSSIIADRPIRIPRARPLEVVAALFRMLERQSFVDVAADAGGLREEIVVLLVDLP